MSEATVLAQELSALIPKVPFEGRAEIQCVIDSLTHVESAQVHAALSHSPNEAAPNYLRYVGGAALAGFVLPLLGLPIWSSVALVVTAFLFAHMKEHEETLRRRARVVEAQIASAESARNVQSARDFKAALLARIEQKGEFDIITHVKAMPN